MQGGVGDVIDTEQRYIMDSIVIPATGECPYIDVSFSLSIYAASLVL